MDGTIRAKEVRKKFPYLNVQARGRPIVYLDSAASAQKPDEVIDRLADFTRSAYANVHRGVHRLSEQATLVYEETRDSLRKFFNAPAREEIVYTAGTTAAINLVAHSWGRTHIAKGDCILLTEMEHHSNLLPWQDLAQRVGARIDYVPILENGRGLDRAAARELLKKRPQLFSFVHVSNVLGVENPVAEWCRQAREVGTVTLVDAAQSAGHQKIDVQETGCDFLVCSAHKMCGPTGIGMLYGRGELLKAMPPWQFGGEMVARSFFDAPAVYRDPPARFEAGTPPIIEAAGFGQALKFLNHTGLDFIHDYGIELAQQAYDGLSQIEGVRCLGPEKREAAMVAFAVEDIHAHDMAFFCDQRGVAVRAGHHCTQPLMKKLGIPSSARASFYMYNTREEVDILVASVREATRFFRS